MGYGMMGGFGGGLGGGVGWIGWIFQIVILVAVIYLVIYAVRSFSGNTKHRSSSSDEAQEILAQRFARGDISAEDYKSMKDQLKN
ncbi:SHOCT domain-containing protein [Alicyclobacillus sp. SO9]|uniref:SHOCT domain-containing protein n=1 Tax=Alicyclobacillus sp. SO9 TaxID=2665646 RepID=UPI0018E8E6D3|nr:SHOCT domain-containing protein [Alicyclobacillus sp. SO9]QQE79811.1 SHOCT domain-containing protein [Alicyclobacillus sp. SO9]